MGVSRASSSSIPAPAISIRSWLRRKIGARASQKGCWTRQSEFRRQRISLEVNQENARAIRFYERAGFERTGEGVNPLSGRPIWRYSWKPG